MGGRRLLANGYSIDQYHPLAANSFLGLEVFFFLQLNTKLLPHDGLLLLERSGFVQARQCLPTAISSLPRALQPTCVQSQHRFRIVDCNGMRAEERLALASLRSGTGGAVNLDVTCSSTFKAHDARTLGKMESEELGPEDNCFLYSRSYNPTCLYLGKLLAALEGTEAAYPFSSGMAAIASTIVTLCSSGDHIVAAATVYGGAHTLMRKFLPRAANIRTTFVDITKLDQVETAITSSTKVLYCEPVSNPTLVVSDLPALSNIAKAHGLTLVVDNTFMPLAVSPKEHGADVVIHSLTKFISGASDIVGGCVCGSAAFLHSMMTFHAGAFAMLGPTMDPRIAAELSLRLPHLPARYKLHCHRAQALAEHLESWGAKVVYPGLKSHPQHELASSLFDREYGYGSILGLDMGNETKAEQLLDELNHVEGFGHTAVSLGYFDSLMCISGATTAGSMEEEERAVSGISPGYIRVAVGYTGTLQQRVQQLERAYNLVTRAEPAAVATMIAEVEELIM